MDYDMTNPYEIAKFIKDAKKATPVKVMIKGDLSSAAVPEGVKLFGADKFWILVGDNQSSRIADLSVIRQSEL